MAHTTMDAQRVDAFASATTLLHALRERRISAAEPLDLHLDHIARYNPALNAIVTPAYDQAQQDAARADGEPMLHAHAVRTVPSWVCRLR